MDYPWGITFVIPCFNEEKNIRSCVLSIQDELKSRKCFSHEIIVADNGSTDSSVAVARSSGARVIEEPRQGVVFAREAGYRNAKYALIANIDADNRMPAGWLNVALREISNPGVAAISGPIRYDDVPFWIIWGSKLFYLVARFFHCVIGPTLQGGNFVIRKDVLDAMHGYDTSFEFYGEDTKTANDASKIGRIVLVPDLWIYSSPRRLKHQGLWNTIFLYTINYFSVSLFKKSVTKGHKDYR
jgi:glycosyltransferase involved in cell wall biosynthesis